MTELSIDPDDKKDRQGYHADWPQAAKMGSEYFSSSPF